MLIAQWGGHDGENSQLLNYAFLYNHTYLIHALKASELRAAQQSEKKIKALMESTHFSDYMYRSMQSVSANIERYGIEYRNVFNFTPLMCAAYVGNADHIRALLARGSSLDAVDNHHRNAFMIALCRGLQDEEWSKKYGHAVYDLLLPPSLSLQTMQRLVKLSPHHAEYFVWLWVYGWLLIRYAEEAQPKGYVVFSSQALSYGLSVFPDSLVPQHRKRREYLNGFLARNEKNSRYQYSRRLFERVKIGKYRLNTDLQLRVQGQWCDVNNAVLTVPLKEKTSAMGTS